jgi:hypothetical protein
MRLPAGTYYVRVSHDYGATNGDYTMTVLHTSETSTAHEKEWNNTQQTANTLNPNSAVTGNFSSSSDVDFYEVTLANPGTFQIEISILSGYYYVTVYKMDTVLEEIQKTSFAHQGKYLANNMRLPAGKYYVRVSHDYGATNGDYTMRAIFCIHGIEPASSCEECSTTSPNIPAEKPDTDTETITIKVTDHLGVPLSGASVKIYPNYNHVFIPETGKIIDTSEDVQRIHITDENGEVMVYADINKFEVSKSGYFDYSWQETNLEPRLDSFEVSLQSRQIVIARIDSNGNETILHKDNAVEYGESIEVTAYVEYPDGRKDYFYDDFDWEITSSNGDSLDVIEWQRTGVNTYLFKSTSDSAVTMQIHVQPTTRDPAYKAYRTCYGSVSFRGVPKPVEDNFDDSWFTHQFYEGYDNELAITSMILSEKAYSKSDVRTQLEKYGFKEIRQDYDFTGGNYTMAVKSITQNRQKILLFAVVVRGSGAITEFREGGTFDWIMTNLLGHLIYVENEHSGFSLTAIVIENVLLDYVKEMKMVYQPDDIRFWFTGHSLGAAVTNIMAKDYINAGFDVIAYTFATPNTYVKNNGKYNERNIYNVVNSSDPITGNPGWKY